MVEIEEPVTFSILLSVGHNGCLFFKNLSDIFKPIF